MSSTITTAGPPSYTLEIQGQEPSKALERARDHFIHAHPKSKQIFEKALKHLPGGNTRTTLFAPPFPIAIVEGSGSKITSADGKEYLDMLGEYTAGIYGHSHPQVIEALQHGLTQGINFGATGPLEGELARLIKRRFEAQAGLEMLRFTNSGTEANLMAIASARVWTGRSKVMVFANAYHGAVQSFSKEIEPVNVPGEYLVAKYNSVPSVQHILSQQQPDALAAILLEPMQGAGGAFPASIKFLEYLRAEATRLGALLIFDEVMTSRLHYDGGLSGKYGIKPDMITMGKYLGGGMSFGLFGGRRDVMSLFDPRAGGPITSKTGTKVETMMLTHSGTFNNNLMTMHAGIAGSKILTPEVIHDVNALGDYLRDSLTKLFTDRGVIPKPLSPFDPNDPDIDNVPRGQLWISGIGSINAIHFGRNDELADLRDLFYFHMLDRGIYTSRRGFISLNIAQIKEDMDRYVDAVKSFVDRWEHVLRIS